MSTIATPSPLPSFLRGKPAPRWSVGGTLALSPASMAGLPASRAWVLVGPPLFASGPSFGSIGLAAVPDHVAVDAVGEAGAAGAVADQVVPLAGEVAGHVRAGAGEVDQVQGDDRVADVERAARVVEDAAAGVGDVLDDGAVEQGRRGREDAAALGRRRCCR